MSTTLIDQLIEPFADCMSRDAARQVMALRADEQMQAQLDSLAAKANLGTLTASEKTDYDQLLAMIHFVALFQARARKLLKS